MNKVYLKYKKPMFWHAVESPELDLVVHTDPECTRDLFRWLGFCKPKVPPRTQKTLTHMGQRYKIVWVEEI